MHARITIDEATIAHVFSAFLPGTASWIYVFEEGLASYLIYRALRRGYFNKRGTLARADFNRDRTEVPFGELVCSYIN